MEKTMEIKDFVNKYLLPTLSKDFKGTVDLQAMFESVYKAVDASKVV